MTDMHGDFGRTPVRDERDIVERLNLMSFGICGEAADEILRLRGLFWDEAGRRGAAELPLIEALSLLHEWGDNASDPAGCDVMEKTAAFLAAQWSGDDMTERPKITHMAVGEDTSPPVPDTSDMAYRRELEQRAEAAEKERDEWRAAKERDAGLLLQAVEERDDAIEAKHHAQFQEAECFTRYQQMKKERDDLLAAREKVLVTAAHFEYHAIREKELVAALEQIEIGGVLANPPPNERLWYEDVAHDALAKHREPVPAQGADGEVYMRLDYAPEDAAYDDSSGARGRAPQGQAPRLVQGVDINMKSGVTWRIEGENEPLPPIDTRLSEALELLAVATPDELDTQEARVWWGRYSKLMPPIDTEPYEESYRRDVCPGCGIEVQVVSSKWQLVMVGGAWFHPECAPDVNPDQGLWDEEDE